jgi:hypothetical protein
MVQVQHQQQRDDKTPATMTTPGSRPVVGNSLVLASILALLSYAPFEYVAKGSLIVCAILFVLNPFPLARLVAVISVVVVGALTRAHRTWSSNHDEVLRATTGFIDEKEEPDSEKTD